MTKKRSRRFMPFGGNKKTGQHAAEIREKLNQIHALEQQLAGEKLLRETRENELRRYLTFPNAAVRDLIFKISYGDAIRLGIDPQLSRLHSWLTSPSGLAAWDEQIKRDVRATVASGKTDERDRAHEWQVIHG